MKTEKSKFNLLALVLLLAVFTQFLISCGGDNDPDPDPDPEDTTDMVQLRADASLGNILTDEDGVTLYFFSTDVAGNVTCSGACLGFWPPFYAENLEVGSGLSESDFDEITVGDTKQTTYKGWPLYYYAPAGDGVIEASGETAGEGANDVWFVAKPDYSVFIAKGQLVGLDGNNYLSDYTVGEGLTEYFVDAEGNTLYAFANDYFNDNTYTAEDLSNNGAWPIFYQEGAIPSTLNEADFGKITVGGQDQMTYKGWPLYYFGQDAARGETKGVSVPVPGKWPILNSSTATAPEEPADPTVTVSTENHLLDADGVSLYYFTKDADGGNHCAGGCVSSWPVFYAEEIILPEGSDMDPALFDEITLADETKQTTYKGWPLYYFAPAADGVIEAPGATAGDGVGSVWYLAGVDFGLMVADAQLVGSNGVQYKSDYTEGTEVTKFFTDDKGRTIYIFVNDAKDDNNYTASDFSNNGTWPIFHTTIDQLPSAFDPTEFGEIDVFGQPQLTFRGWPLYYFGSDTERGETKGVSVPSPGIWPIVNFETVEAQ